MVGRNFEYYGRQQRAVLEVCCISNMTCTTLHPPWQGAPVGRRRETGQQIAEKYWEGRRVWVELKMQTARMGPKERKETALVGV